MSFKIDLRYNKVLNIVNVIVMFYSGYFMMILSQQFRLKQKKNSYFLI